jgi:hypothetical protein
MDNRNQFTDDNQGKNLGKTLIQWMRIINEKKADRQAGSVNLYIKGVSDSRQYPDLLSVKIKNADSLRNSKDNFYPE